MTDASRVVPENQFHRREIANLKLSVEFIIGGRAFFSCGRSLCKLNTRARAREARQILLGASASEFGIFVINVSPVILIVFRQQGPRFRVLKGSDGSFTKPTRALGERDSQM